MPRQEKPKRVEVVPIEMLLASYSLLPQYPQKLVKFDGQTWIYESDCCDADQHLGIFYSGRKLLQGELGCPGKPNPNPVSVNDGLEYAIPGEPGSPPSGDTFVLSKFDWGAPGTLFDAGLDSFDDYYRGGPTAVAVTDRNWVTKWFTLVKFPWGATSVPMLVQSRSGPWIFKNDFTAVLPVRTLAAGNRIPFDFSSDGLGSVVLSNLPDPSSPGTAISFQAIILNRV